ncbi:C39 family peptidase [Mesobacillus subterraneus]|uniref:C39 family peptidase n=2 Tax=Mesobacillus TaxID=2675231 RepID=UPI0020416820|nr:C39 family peptidase [Mesobacillus subterraneus]MCM3576054.1 C39 family peptidase [Mesobacillus subterraneus]
MYMTPCINSPKLNDNMVTKLTGRGSTKIKTVILSHAIIMVTLIFAFLIGAIFIFYDRGESLDKVLAMGGNVKGQATLIKDSVENEGPIKEKVIVRIKDKVLLDAPVVKQFPELPRGCEVTSLAMLLQYNDIDVDKMELASGIKKNPVLLEKREGVTYWGHPNDGYIGDMYTYEKPGFGVYHRPIAELAEEYLPGKVKDITGADFSVIKTYLSLDLPIWVIINTTYKKLPASYFEEWITPSGPVSITYKEHSVLITGYDDKYIYFNDPITGIKNRKEPYSSFEEAWEQMGKQAIVIFPDP